MDHSSAACRASAGRTARNSAISLSIRARRRAREFRAPATNRLRVSDFTYVATWTGFVSFGALARRHRCDGRPSPFVIDVHARRIVGWRVSGRTKAGFVLDALEQALHARRRAESGLIHHSDQRGPVRLDQVPRAPCRGGDRTLRRKCRGQPRQRAGRDDQRPLQDRGHSPARAMALPRGRRVRHARMGRLVQHPASARADRQHPARRGRTTLPRRTGDSRRGSVALKAIRLRETRRGSSARTGACLRLVRVARNGRCYFTIC